MSETMILACEQMGLSAVQWSTTPSEDISPHEELYPFVIGPEPLTEDNYDVGGGD